MTITESVRPLLTRLELQGFKSFANRTVFVFESGITAVIGPNGSGKSNISDGVRWVLGETSHSLLRSKKTEDVIFVGGNGKAPAGMAEVSVTFDNTTGWLPIEFNEVTVTRRAFRSGENQYLINGRKVRLKDVQHLTASLGHSHTVVGQGLVDAALSQRPEERRGLFEHAADLTGLQLKVTEAERNLAEAEANAERINDLLTDVEPRMRTLERAAKQAREWQGVHDRLRWLEQGYYRHSWQDARAVYDQALQTLEQEQARAEAARTTVEELSGTLKQSRVDTEEHRAGLARLETSLETITDQIRRVGHERDLAGERLAALERRQSDMRETQQGLDEQSAKVERDLALAREELSAANRELESARLSQVEAQRQVTRARDAQSARDRQGAQLANAALTIERQLNEVHQRWALLEQRRETGAHERERAVAAETERCDRLAQLRGEIDELANQDVATDTELQNIDAAVALLLERAAEASRDEKAAAVELSAIERRLGEAQARFEALQRIHDSGAGLYAGVRAVVEANRNGTLSGIRGTLSELVSVEVKFDTAIEVALGSHLQDIVVERWVDAEAAIAYLKRSHGGRGTFQPLDTVRGTAVSAFSADVSRTNGVFGVAALLVKASDGVEQVTQGLLGRTVVVDEMETARRLLPGLPAGWSVVTLAGEIVRTGGSVTGGSAVRESGVLGRERELRELPDQIRAFERERDAVRERLAKLAFGPQRIAEERRERDAERAALVATRRERGSQRSRLHGWLDELQREQRAAQERVGRLLESEASSAAELAKLQQEAERLEGDLDQARLAREQLRERAGEDADSLASLEIAYSTASGLVATLEERVRSESRRQSGLTAQRNALAEELAVRTERSAVISGEIEAVRQQVERLDLELQALTSERDRSLESIAPARTLAADAGQTLERLELRLEQSRTALFEAERVRGLAELSAERTRGDLATLRQRIEDDLELLEPDELLGLTIELEDGIEETAREISRLKERLRRVGYVGEEAVAEFERESARHQFLREQLDDVEGASSALRALLDDLRTTMRKRFDETFERVAVAFSDAFTVLFGGGTARLVMVANENGQGAGVDIVAQPPGKRLQSLALLSGGERSLTAAALLFAILQVNPTPFVLLDEVDAALDEANIVRFRERLQQLGRETQAVIITHNRGTIEVADSLYGVSMRDDGVSTVLSLRMSEAEPVELPAD